MNIVLYRDVLTVYYLSLLEFVYSSSYLTSFIELMLMHIITGSIKHKYKTINERLQRMTAQTALNKTCLSDKVDVSIRTDEISTTKREKVVVIEELLTEHFQLTTVAKKSNIFFGIPVLITLASNFQWITVCVYHILYLSKIGKLTHIFVIMWSIPLIFQIWLIVQMWSSLANEVSIFKLSCNT